MSNRFPELPTFAEFDAPGRVEADAIDLEFEGEVPRELVGTFSRVAPDPQFPPRLGEDIFFNGDGRVCAFRIRDGRVDFRSRYVGRPYRHVFVGEFDPASPYDFERSGPPSVNASINGLGHIDLVTGQTRKWFPGSTATVQEPVFASRSSDSPQGDGFVIALVNRLAARRSELVILDTQRFEEGPVATVRAPVRLRSGLYGNWVHASELPGARI